MANILTNIYLWMGGTFLFLIMFLLLFIFVIILFKKTHALVELKGWMQKKNIGLFFLENRYCDWKAIKPEAGIVTDKNYGAFIVNEKATYIDSRTKTILIPFDAQFGASVNVHAAKLADDLQYIAKDDESMGMLRNAISTGKLAENASINVLKTSVNFGALKGMMTALIPHNINAKIEKTIASRMKGFGQPNLMSIMVMMAGIVGAVALSVMIIKLTLGK